MKWLVKGLFRLAWFIIKLPFILFFRSSQSDRRINEYGYVLKISKKSGKARYEHRVVAEAILGRRLESWEVVHHINGERTDNRPSNLCVMPRPDHDSYHAWYDWIVQTYGKYPRRETQLNKLRGRFNGILLSDVMNRKTGN